MRGALTLIKAGMPTQTDVDRISLGPAQSLKADIKPQTALRSERGQKHRELAAVITPSVVEF